MVGDGSFDAHVVATYDAHLYLYLSFFVAIPMEYVLFTSDLDCFLSLCVLYLASFHLIKLVFVVVFCCDCIIGIVQRAQVVEIKCVYCQKMTVRDFLFVDNKIWI